MPDSQWLQFVELLKEARRIEFDAPLTDAEMNGIEARHGIRFPADLRKFLQTALPVSDGFPNWRSETVESLQERLGIPLEGVLFDVECNDFWLPEWGPKPSKLEDAKHTVRQLIAEAPKLIPIWKHRMIPDRPHDAGNPVFSVHQTDIIYYGVDLRDYLIHEFLAENHGFWPIPDNIRKIDFWNIERFLNVRWADGVAVFDNRKGILP